MLKIKERRSSVTNRLSISGLLLPPCGVRELGYYCVRVCVLGVVVAVYGRKVK